MAPDQVSRRQVLVFGGLALGVGMLEVAVDAAPARAEGQDGLRLEPVTDEAVPVLSSDTAPAACPRLLAVRVVNDAAALPAGSRLTVQYDARLFAPVSPAAVTLGGRPVAASSTIAATDESGLNTCTVVLAEPVPVRSAKGGELVVVMGVAHQLRYPEDLVRRPASASAALAATTRSPGARRGLPGRRPSVWDRAASAWGVEVSGVWNRQSWGDGDRFSYFHPARVSLRSVGPGPTPRAASFAVSLDPRLVRGISAHDVLLNRKRTVGLTLVEAIRTTSLYRTVWRSATALRPGDLIDVGFRVVTSAPTGPLESITHPLVAMASTAADLGQRRTGQDDFTRHDAVWQ